MNDRIDIVKALLELDFICIDVDKKDTYIYKMLNDLILFIEKVSKVEELLGLYQQKEKLSKNPYKNIDTKELKPFYEWACEIEELENKIRSLRRN